ncbi:putative ABC transporter ATP-binding protein [Candidatus Methanoperedenaceae archaeon GB50]|nr:putative ABC transporter ATP-binding protein [Candidatus Methanoperedenaceae archaeon GB50]
MSQFRCTRLILIYLCLVTSAVMTLISIEHLNKSFGPSQVIVDLSLEVVEGELLTIFGPNGAGKTTLLKILSTLLSSTSGSVVVDGFDVRKSPVEVRRRIGVISHDTYLYRDLTAVENLVFYARMYDLSNRAERVREVIRLVGLEYYKDDRVATFSRGMKQRLSIARAILHEPKILLLDEPYTGLDLHASSILDRIIQEFDSRGVTRIMVSHDIEHGLRFSDRLLIMKDGGFVHDVRRSEIGSVGEYRAIYEELVGDRS